MSDGAQISLKFAKTDELVSLAKMHGFLNINVNEEGVLQATKAALQSGGTSLKNRKKVVQAPAAENPWENLDKANGSDEINEDDLMGDDQDISKVTAKFCGDGDRIMPGKPCENCTCGKKELMDGTITTEQLESGQVESSCGKCYLGDAFRCASCPFLGKPAFEAGDKVKLQNADVAQTLQKPEEGIKTSNTGSSKVVLEL